MATTQVNVTTKKSKPQIQPKQKQKYNEIKREVPDYVSFSEVFALHDIALRFPKTPFSAFTMRETISALTGRLDFGLQKFGEALPPQHPALEELKAARLLLRSIKKAAESFCEYEDVCKYAASKLQAGVTLKTLVVDLGMAVERIRGEHWGYESGAVKDPFQ